MFNNKIILITGGTGSFGNAFISHLLRNYKCKKIIIFSRDELKQYNMQKKFEKFKNLRFFIGDVRDLSRLKLAFRGVDYVIHAAALKHVPIAEYNPIECIKTNIDGSSNVIAAALENKVKKVIALSTDKAVNPINLYGATKLCAEKIFVTANALTGNVTNFSVVRYGNVLNSSGSIIPLIKKYKEEKKQNFPLTDNRMTRFFISLEGAVEFVIQSFKNMDKGEIFVPKMPSVYIKDLINVISPKMSIKISGIRPGEKIDEILISKDESAQTIEEKNSYIVCPNNTFVNSSLLKKFKDKKKLVNFEYNSKNNKNLLKVKEIVNILKKY
jgi:UDP-N-acetylglucosamine 4,6-dehydratase/5-epimerase